MGGIRCVFFDFSGFINFLKGIEKCGNVRFVGIKSDRDGFGLEVTDDILDALLKSDIFHNLIAARLAMQVNGKNDHLFVCLRGKQPYGTKSKEQR